MRHILISLFLGFILPLSLSAESVTEFSERFPAYVKEGKPCKVEYSLSRSRNSSWTYYLNREGAVVMVRKFSEYTNDKEIPTEAFKTTYIFSEKNLIAKESIEYKYKRNSRVDSTRTFLNNYAQREDKKVRYSKPFGGKITYDSSAIDRHRNWIEGIRIMNYREETVTRKIYYYDEDIAETAETEALAAELIPIVAQCMEKEPPKPKKPWLNLSEKSGLIMNIIVPALVGFLFGFLPGMFFRKRRNVSNLMIILITIGLAIMVGYPLVTLLYGAGPYYSLWAVVFWVLVIITFLYGFSFPLRGRCPKCASLDSVLLKEKITKKITRTTQEFGDGTVERSKKVDIEREHKFGCNECGCTWWEYVL